MNSNVSKILLLLGSIASINAFAEIRPFEKHCLDGNRKERESEADQIISRVVQASGFHFTTETIDAQKAPGLEGDNGALTEKQKRFYSALGAEMMEKKCYFTTHAQFDSIDSVKAALVRHAFEMKKVPSLPTWLKPGFKTVIAGFDSDNTIYVKMTEDGLIFRRCIANPNDGPAAVAPDPSDDNAVCGKMENSSVFVPPLELVHNTSGIKHDLSLTLKVFGEIAVMATANLGLSYVSSIAQTAINFANPNPLGTIQRNAQIANTMKDLLNFAPKVAKDGSFIITRIMPYKFQDLDDGVMELLKDLFKAGYKKLHKLDKSKNNPSLNEETIPVLKMERNFNQHINGSSSTSANPAGGQGTQK